MSQMLIDITGHADGFEQQDGRNNSGLVDSSALFMNLARTWRSKTGWVMKNSAPAAIFFSSSSNSSSKKPSADSGIHRGANAIRGRTIQLNSRHITAGLELLDGFQQLQQIKVVDRTRTVVVTITWFNSGDGHDIGDTQGDAPPGGRPAMPDDCDPDNKPASRSPTPGSAAMHNLPGSSSSSPHCSSQEPRRRPLRPLPAWH